MAWTFLIVALLAVSAPAYAAKPQNSQLSMILNGGTLSVGDQSYSQHGGSLMGAMILGQPVGPSQATLDFGLRAHVSGVNAKGDASFNLAINNADGSVTKVEGDAQISDMVPVPGATFSDGSTVPAFFVGLASISVQLCNGQQQDSSGQGAALLQDGHGDQGNNCNTTNQYSVPMEFESAYLNPFGGPILMMSLDTPTSISIVSSYSQASIDWKGIQLGGFVSGMLDSQTVSGNFAMTVNAHENLLAGTESEKGSISLVGMSPSSLNANGHFDGHSVIPKDTAFDCGAPFPCTMTGLNSQGSFSMHSSGGEIDGSYAIMWNVPAFLFGGQASATVAGH